MLLHAITSPPETTSTGMAGLRGCALGALHAAGLTAWSSDVSTGVGKFTRSDLLDHHRVVTDIFARVDACLPARFPTLLEPSQLDALLVERHEALTRLLEAVRGACELAVTGVWTTPEPSRPAPTSGRAYLLRRQADLARADRAAALAELIERSVGGDLRDSRRQVCPSKTVAFSAALLVPRDRAKTIVECLPRAESDVRILVNGPWPPYTFADLTASRNGG